MINSLTGPVRERLTAQSGSSDLGLFGATPGTFGSREADHSQEFSIAAAAAVGETTESSRGGSPADSHVFHSSSLELEPNLALSPQLTLTAPAVGTLGVSLDLLMDTRAEFSVARSNSLNAHDAIVQPGAQGLAGEAAYAGKAEAVVSHSPAAPDSGSTPSLAEALPSAQELSHAAQPLANAAQALDAAQIQTLADSIRSQLDTLAKLLPTELETVQGRIDGIQADAMQTLQATVEQITSEVQAIDLTQNALSATAPVLDTTFAAIPAVTGATIDAATATASAAGAGIHGIVETSASTAQDVVPSVGDTLSTVEDQVAGTAGSLVGELDGGLAGNDVGGGITTLMSLLQAGDGFVVEDVQTGETLFGSADAPLQAASDLADFGQGVLDTGIGDDAVQSDSLLGVITHGSDGIGGILDQDEGLHG